MLDDLMTIDGSLAGLGRASNRILSLGTLGTCFTFTSLGIRGGPSGLAGRHLDRAIRRQGRYRTYSRGKGDGENVIGHPVGLVSGRKMKRDRYVWWLGIDIINWM